MASLLHTAGVKSVTELTEYLRVALEGDPNLHGVWVRGEVSNLTRAASGHIYFTVKDGGAQLKCVMWKSAAIKQSFTPQNGAAVEAYGFITVYAQRGEYQLQAERVRPVGVGDLYARFEALKA
ncbi:MAG: exodeoxyribonuclease VII large subunit, partial [Armatimonadetes bacterium]|nr:exodeoxyribonuclease VII large subunit [Anaerolineae bacterium]